MVMTRARRVSVVGGVQKKVMATGSWVRGCGRGRTNESGLWQPKIGAARWLRAVRQLILDVASEQNLDVRMNVLRVDRLQKLCTECNIVLNIVLNMADAESNHIVRMFNSLCACGFE